MKVIIVLKKFTRRYKIKGGKGGNPAPVFSPISKFILEIKKKNKKKSRKGFKTAAGFHALHASLLGLP